jgi:hypothetical protein
MYHDSISPLLAFANTRRTRPAYIIVGISNDKKIVGISEGRDDAMFQALFRTKVTRRSLRVVLEEHPERSKERWRVRTLSHRLRFDEIIAGFTTIRRACQRRGGVALGKTANRRFVTAHLKIQHDVFSLSHENYQSSRSIQRFMRRHNHLITERLRAVSRGHPTAQLSRFFLTDVFESR